MRPWLLAPVVVLMTLAPSAEADPGGAAAPSGTGGAEHGAAAPKPRPAAPALRASLFTVAPGSIQPGGAPVVFTYRIDGGARRVRVRIDIVAAGARGAIRRLRLGFKPTGQRRTHRWALPAGALPAGEYVARLHAVDDAGRTLRRSARASGRSAMRVGAALVHVGPGVFPVGGGAWSFGEEEARFGADRGDHDHEGQDIMAAEGTPILAPRAGWVYFKSFQSGGAGHYLVLRADDGRDMAFMHLRVATPLAKGDTVTAGQQIGEVGNTGRSSTPHLHFEIWPDGWYAKDSRPVDPRPDLDAWARQPPS